jgi:hypothetical protein
MNIFIFLQYLNFPGAMTVGINFFEFVFLIDEVNFPRWSSPSLLTGLPLYGL